LQPQGRGGDDQDYGQPRKANPREKGFCCPDYYPLKLVTANGRGARKATGKREIFRNKLYLEGKAESREVQPGKEGGGPDAAARNEFS